MGIPSSSRARDIASWVIKINRETAERVKKDELAGAKIPDIYQKEVFKTSVYHIERLLRYAVAPEQAAQEFANSVDALFLASGERDTWYIFNVIIHAIRTLGQDTNLSLRLHDFLEALSHIVVADDFWHSWAIKFRSCAYDMQDIDNSGFPPYVTPDEWLAQRPVLLGTETFTAICVAKRPGLDIYETYGVASLEWIVDPEYDYPEDPGYELAMYVSTAAVWMHLAARQIYEYCRKGDTTWGECSLELWEEYRVGFQKIAAFERIAESIRDEARQAVVNMGIAESDWAAVHKC